MKSYSVCLSLPDLFHIAQYLPGPSILSQVARFQFCWCLSNFPIYIDTPIFLPIYLSIDTLVASVLAIVNNAAVNIEEYILEIYLRKIYSLESRFPSGDFYTS